MQMMANSNLLISNDTGIRNIGIALEIPTIGIFFHIPPFRYWPREEIHDCVYNREYTIPKVESVYKSAVSLMEKLI
jgi:ADP-heptose:LPS heptosyltransferase